MLNKRGRFSKRSVGKAQCKQSVSAVCETGTHIYDGVCYVQLGRVPTDV